MEASSAFLRMKFGSPSSAVMLLAAAFLLSCAPRPGWALMSPQKVQRFTVGLDDGSLVTVDTISQYPHATVATMVIAADRSTQTGCPFSVRKKGLIRAGDRVLVTDYYIAWFDYTFDDGVAAPGWPQSTFDRSGALAGLWSLDPTTVGPTGVYFKNVVGFTNATYGICFNWPRNELEPGSYSPTGVMNWWDKYSPPNENTIGVVNGANIANGIEAVSVHYGDASLSAGFTMVDDGLQDANMAVHYSISKNLADSNGNTGLESISGGSALIHTNFAYVANEAGITVYWNFLAAGGSVYAMNVYSSLWQSYAFLTDGPAYPTTDTTCGNSSPQAVLDTLPIPTNLPPRNNTANNPLPYGLTGSPSFAGPQENTFESATSNLPIYFNNIPYLTCNGSLLTAKNPFCPVGQTASFAWTAIESSAPNPTPGKPATGTPAPCIGTQNLDLQVFDYAPNAVPTALPLPSFSPAFPSNNPANGNTSRAIQAGDMLSLSQPNGTTWVVTNLRAPFTGTAASGIGFPLDRMTLSYEHSDLDTNTNLIRGPYSQSSYWFTLQQNTTYSIVYSITRAPSTVVIPAASVPSPSTTPVVTAGISRNCDVASIAHAYPPTASYQLEYIYCLMLARLPDTGGETTYTQELENGQLTWQQMMDITFNSTEFNTHYNVGGLTNTQFVTGLYELLLSRAPDPNGLASYVQDLNSGNFTRQQVFDAFIAGQEFLNDSPVLSMEL